MTVETHLHRALDRVEAERETVTDKRDVLETFADRVRSLSTTGVQPKQASQTVTGPISNGSGGPDRREKVRSAFAETVSPHVESDEFSALTQELGEEVALALAPVTNAQFTPGLQSQVLSAVEARRRKLSVTERALKREVESLETHRESIETVTEWLVEADETPLSELDFDALRARHDQLEGWQSVCADVAETRQELLTSTTSEAGQVGVSHRSLVGSLYEDFPVDYPALSTATRLYELCEDARRVVRSYLARRV